MLQTDPNAVQIIAQVAGNLPSAGVLLWALTKFLAQHKADMEMLRDGQAAHSKKLDAVTTQLQELRVEAAGKVCHAPVRHN